MRSDSEVLWKNFSLRHSLSSAQLQRFQEYYVRLVRTNALHNITAITNLDGVITDHFDDSLSLKNFIDCTALQGIADIGTGAGFPGIPLKILFPSLPLFLIEVSEKKRTFLAEVCDVLSLTDVTIIDLDWRTFFAYFD